MDIPSYYTHAGCLFVYPYWTTYVAHAKQRWAGRALLDVYCNEFVQGTLEYYRKAILNGHITINGQRCTPDGVIGESDIIEHRCHQHEKPVAAIMPKITKHNHTIYIINKPASMPMTPVGCHRHTSLAYVLKRMLGVKMHFPYRLDRATSGLVVCCTDAATAHTMCTQLETRRVQKYYLAIVRGQFQETEMNVEEPIAQLDPKYGIYGVDSNGKYASTHFVRLLYDNANDISLLLCHPKTGRTHQIRVHLFHLGYPILKDIRYGGCDADINPDLFFAEQNSFQCNGNKKISAVESCYIAKPFDKNLALNAYCADCFQCREDFVAGEFKAITCTDTKSLDMIYLHALAYWSPLGRFSVELPRWANSSSVRAALAHHGIVPQ